MLTGLELILKRDCSVVIGGLALAVVLAWGYLLAGAGMGMCALEMTRMASGKGMAMDSGSAVMQPAAWTFGYALLMLVMWWIMMVAMPSAAPTILLTAALNRRARPGRVPYGASGFFTGGYLIAWGFFSLVAVAAQWGSDGKRAPLLYDAHQSGLGGSINGHRRTLAIHADQASVPQAFSLAGHISHPAAAQGQCR